MPLDYVFAIRRVLRRIQPSLLIVLETEIWPNLFSQAQLAGCGVTLVNGRISDRTWPKYRAWGWLFRAILDISDRIYVQSRQDAERFCGLGASERKITVGGNLKYDAAAHPLPLPLETFGAEQIWIAASTVGPDEGGNLQRHSICEELEIIEVYRKLALFRKRLLLVIAPRQPARFDAVARLLAGSGLPFVRRSEQVAGRSGGLTLPGVLLLDTMGELSRIYGAADVVFVGGSLAPRGGHNILEPAFAGVPVVVGPHMQNFAAICRDFLDAHAIEQVADSAGLATVIARLLDNPSEAKALGESGRVVAQGGLGAAERLGGELTRLHSISRYRRPKPWIARLALGTLAALWDWGGKRKRRRSERIARARAPLGPPVISVGGITLGGSGKTPLVNYLAIQLREQGFNPAILTRGYRRRSPAKHLILSPGMRMPSSFTGDEAQIYLRSGDAAVGIGADRYETGAVLLKHYPNTDIFLMDDGFQHAKLPRDIDIVVIDGLDPFGGNQVLPAGRLREPLEALARADVFAVTRAQSPEHFRAVEERLREMNARAPVFECRLTPIAWCDAETGERAVVPAGTRVAAFCGLGNPQNFFSTVEGMGLNIIIKSTFGDHHPYKPVELRYLASTAHQNGATFLVTTEKDRVNFPERANDALKGVRTVWLQIEITIDGEDRFFNFIQRALRRGQERPSAIVAIS